MNDKQLQTTPPQPTAYTIMLVPQFMPDSVIENTPEPEGESSGLPFVLFLIIFMGFVCFGWELFR